MTRFWLTLTHACELVRFALETMEGGEIFVPKIKTASVPVLAAAIGGPDWPMQETGLRVGGEKLHEALLSDEEPGRTYDLGEAYAVLPHPHPWRATWEPEGEKVPDGFRYTSDTAFRYSVEELRELLKDVP